MIGSKSQSEFIFYKEEYSDTINITLKHNGDFKQKFPSNLVKNILNHKKGRFFNNRSFLSLNKIDL